MLAAARSSCLEALSCVTICSLWGCNIHSGLGTGHLLGCGQSFFFASVRDLAFGGSG